MRFTVTEIDGGLLANQLLTGVKWVKYPGDFGDMNYDQGL